MSDGPSKLRSAFLYYPRLRRVRDYVRRNYAGKISLKRVARIANLEEKYFSAYFRQKTGLCFKDWVAQIRVRHAKAMMRSRDYNITEIAFAVGFRDLRTFERAFKRCTGMTPSAFRNSVRPG